MGSCDNFNHQPTVVLDSASIHDADKFLNHLALAIRYRDNYLPPPLPEKPPYTRWSDKCEGNGTENLNLPVSRSECQSEQISPDRKITEPGPWDERAAETKIYLMRRLYQAALNREVELRNLFDDRAKEPPKDPNDIPTWVKTGNIYTSDLLKFCGKERVKVEFEGENNHGDSEKHLPSSSSSLQGNRVAPPEKKKDLSAPPGKIPKVAIGKLTIAAAWEIELELGRPALTSEVMQRLQQWVETNEGDCLKPSRKKNCVDWETKDGKPKTFDLDACGAALRAWRASRQC